MWLVFNLVWRGVEKLMLGAPNPNSVDSVIGIILLPIMYLAVSNIEDRLDTLRNDKRGGQ